MIISVCLCLHSGWWFPSHTLWHIQACWWWYQNWRADFDLTFSCSRGNVYDEKVAFSDVPFSSGRRHAFLTYDKPQKGFGSNLDPTISSKFHFSIHIESHRDMYIPSALSLYPNMCVIYRPSSPLPWSSSNMARFQVGFGKSCFMWIHQLLTEEMMDVEFLRILKKMSDVMLLSNAFQWSWSKNNCLTKY